jgi:hypothetical protein
MSISLKTAGQGKFLNKKSIDAGAEVTLMINDIDMVDMSRDDQAEDLKACITFEDENYKPMPLNKTNLKFLEMAVGGTEPADYQGKMVCIWHDPSIANPGGEIVGGLRIRPIPVADIPM